MLCKHTKLYFAKKRCLHNQESKLEKKMLANLFLLHLFETKL